MKVKSDVLLPEALQNDAAKVERNNNLFVKAEIIQFLLYQRLNFFFKLIGLKI